MWAFPRVLILHSYGRTSAAEYRNRIGHYRASSWQKTGFSRYRMMCGGLADGYPA